MTGPTTKASNHQDQILALLIARGPQGVTNLELNRDVCFRYGARIYELRQQGHLIETVRLGEGLFRFVYRFHSSRAGASSSSGTPAPSKAPSGSVQIGLFAEAT